LPVAERAPWFDLLAETDAIYGQMSRDEKLSSELQAKLLAIPDEQPEMSLLHRLRNQPIGWMHYAATVLLLIGMGWYVNSQLQTKHGHPPVVSMLNPQLADAMSHMAIDHESAPLQINSSDPAVVQQALAKQNLSFTPMILQPSAKLALRGGGVFNFKSAKVVFTRWSGDGVDYTLYQLDPYQIGAPLTFPKVVDTTSTPQRVVIWSGTYGPCTWVLALNNDKAVDHFSGG
jgi:hypothetical protein